MPKRMVQEWEAETLYERVKRCRQMLFLHGLLSYKENVKVWDRLNKMEARLKGEEE